MTSEAMENRVNVTLLVEEQCSGVHGLYALIALGVAWIAFVPRPRWVAASQACCGERPKRLL